MVWRGIGAWRGGLVGLLAWSVGWACATPLQVLHSCVSDDAALRLGPRDAQALLDSGDRLRVHAAVLVRYPMLLRDGFAPSQILLWQRAGGELLYLTLQEAPDKPGGLCFSASFTADSVDFTPSLVGKYLFKGAGRS